MQEGEISAAAAARLTGLSERTIRRKIAAKEIPARQIARNRYAIRVQDLPASAAHPVEISKRIELLEYQVDLLEQHMSGLLGALEAPARTAPSATLVEADATELMPVTK